ncbi:NGG1 interacting factor 3 [Strigomonas culicis]|uniref:NGG1 interacting factor 3 n=3 Tax=Strigomonas culicis TaxID=28005 RepID=S9USK9_9TRYP|nr:NGG1 interacting factor 3 [Strigomonas culicis]|eukprot:EPY31784.1 NGG1 interacting factor 3 [Strigomonas culicis]
MALLARVTSAMAQIAPLALADRSWDNVGVLVESPAPNQKNTVMLTIDLTPEVVEECLRKNVEVILAYHPPIFASFKRLTLANTKQRIVLQVVQAGMSVYSPHTALDAAAGGVNDWLASLIDAAGACRPIQPTSVDGTPPSPRSAATTTTGIGRVLQLAAPKPLEEVVADVKRGLRIPTARVALPDGWARDHAVRSVAICAGSGSSVFQMLKAPVDVLLSGEMGHHDVLAATAAGQAVILCEHTNTERGYLAQVLAPRLRALLGDDVNILVAEEDHDPLLVW